MKGNSAWPGGSLTSRPTWSNTPECSATSAFLFRLNRHAGAGLNSAGRFGMVKVDLAMVYQIQLEERPSLRAAQGTYRMGCGAPGGGDVGGVADAIVSSLG
jgi:hypothetical protein